MINAIRTSKGVASISARPWHTSYPDILKSYLQLRAGKGSTIRNRSERLTSLGDNLSHLLSPFHELLLLSVEDETYLKLEPRQRRERTFEALRDFFVRLSQEKPVILVVEDLHWVDKTSEDFLTYLIGCLANTRIMLIVLYRPDYTHPWTNRSYYSRVWLNELPESARHELLESLLPDLPVSQPLRDFIIQKAGGNPRS
jgi:predicted ATPase